MGLAMTYDGADGYVLAVSLNASSGPFNNTYGANELTWKFSAGNWSLIATTGQVPATLGPGLVYDARDGYVLLYGGRLMATLPAPVTNQTWSYLAGTWTNLSQNSTAAPTAIDFPNLVYDAHDEYVLLYDEVGLGGSPNGTLWTTWSYAAGVWTNLTATAGAAPPSFFGAMTYDARDQYVVYFGGETLADELTNATWVFHGGTWSNLTANVTGAPGGRLAFGLTYDSALDEVLLYGGVVQLGDFNWSAYGGDTWGYASGTWTLLANNGSVYNPQGWNPPQMDMVYDPADNETVLFGANMSGSSPTAVTWTFSNSLWTVAAPAFVRAARVADTGHPLTLSVSESPHPGALSYSYTGLPSGCRTVNASTLTCVPTSAGDYRVVVTILGDGGFAASAVTTVEVNPAPAILAFAPTSAVGEVGLAIGLRVTAANGTGPLSYSYAGLPAGCVSVNASALSCVPTASGEFPVTAQVTDSLGTVVLADSEVTVVPSLAVTNVALGRAALDVGQQLALQTLVGGGEGPFSFAYTGLPAGCSTANGSALDCRPTVAGTFPVSVGARDSLGGSAEASTTVVVNPLPTLASFEPSEASVPFGGSVRLVATISGGTEPFQYQFEGLPSGCTWNGGPQANCTNTPSGASTVTVTVTDATGASVNGTTTFVTGASAQVVGPHGPAGAGSAVSGFWWGLALGAIGIAIAAIVGGNRIRLQRQGDRIVRDLRDPPRPSSPSDSTAADGRGPPADRES
jgi:hypothetical protein